MSIYHTHTGVINEVRVRADVDRTTPAWGLISSAQVNRQAEKA